MRRGVVVEQRPTRDVLERAGAPLHPPPAVVGPAAGVGPRRRSPSCAARSRRQGSRPSRHGRTVRVVRDSHGGGLAAQGDLGSRGHDGHARPDRPRESAGQRPGDTGRSRRAARARPPRPTSGSRGATPVGPLHGLPLAVKDTEPTAGLRTTWGSPLFADHVPDEDSPLVAARACGWRDRRRQEQRARVRRRLAHVQRGLRGDAQPLRPRPAPPGAAAEEPQPPWPAGWWLSPTAATSAVRCATRRRSAGWSGSGPRSGRVPSLPGVRTGGTFAGRARADGPDRRGRRLAAQRPGWAGPTGGLVAARAGDDVRSALASDLTGLRVAGAPGSGSRSSPRCGPWSTRPGGVRRHWVPWSSRPSRTCPVPTRRSRSLRARLFADELGAALRTNARRRSRRRCAGTSIAGCAQRSGGGTGRAAHRQRCGGGSSAFMADHRRARAADRAGAPVPCGDRVPARGLR